MRVMLRQRDSGTALTSGDARIGDAARRRVRALRQSTRAHQSIRVHQSTPARTPLLGAVVVSAAGTSGVRAFLAKDGVPIFLVLLVVLLALCLSAIMRMQPPERRSAADSMADTSRPVPSSARQRAPRPASRPVGPVPQPRRPVRPEHRAYAPRHVPGPHPELAIRERPPVSGGPPWGPAPRPPGA
jgi:hypothetical protein